MTSWFGCLNNNPFYLWQWLKQDILRKQKIQGIDWIVKKKKVAICLLVNNGQQPVWSKWHQKKESDLIYNNDELHITWKICKSKWGQLWSHVDFEVTVINSHVNLNVPLILACSFVWLWLDRFKPGHITFTTNSNRQLEQKSNWRA